MRDKFALNTSRKTAHDPSNQEHLSLSHFRQNTREHLERLAEGRVETITQNGEATMVVMSPATFDRMKARFDRTVLWEQAVALISEGRGRDARQVIREVAAEMDLEL